MRKANILAESLARKKNKIKTAVNGLLYVAVMPLAEEEKMMCFFPFAAANLWRQISRLPFVKILAMQDSSQSHHL